MLGRKDNNQAESGLLLFCLRTHSSFHQYNNSAFSPTAYDDITTHAGDADDDDLPALENGKSLCAPSPLE